MTQKRCRLPRGIDSSRPALVEAAAAATNYAVCVWTAREMLTIIGKRRRRKRMHRRWPPNDALRLQQVRPLPPFGRPNLHITSISHVRGIWTDIMHTHTAGGNAR